MPKPELGCGARLRELRQEKGRLAGREITAAEVAKAIGVSESTMYMYERGERTPPADNLVALANYYAVTADYLLGRTEERGLNPFPEGEVVVQRRYMNIPPPGWDRLTPEQREQAMKQAREYEEFIVRRMLDESRGQGDKG